MESILTSVKKMLGLTEDYTHFDPDIIMHINSVFMVLNQLGVGPSKGFMISDASSVWEDFISENSTAFSSVKSYVFMKVKLLFDPPLNSSVTESYNRLISELEWRLNVEADKNVRFEVISNSDGIILTDRSTNIDYELYVEDSKLKIAEEDED